MEIVFDVSFNFPVNCVPATKPVHGIFISYTHYDNVTYYDVICNNKSSYFVRSVGRRLYLKFVMSGVSFSYRGRYYYGMLSLISNKKPIKTVLTLLVKNKSLLVLRIYNVSLHNFIYRGYLASHFLVKVAITLISILFINYNISTFLISFNL